MAHSLILSACRRRSLFGLFTVLLGLAGCREEEDVFKRPGPAVVVVGDVTSLEQVQQGPVRFAFEARAVSGLREVVLSRDGQVLRTEAVSGEEFVRRFSLTETVPATAAPGSTIRYSAIATDRDGQVSAETSLLVRVVASTFSLSNATVGAQAVTTITGAINRDFTFDAATAWLLDGPVTVTNGATLTIEPGTRIYGRLGNFVSLLSIQPGARLEAQGTEMAPIVFSSEQVLRGLSPTPGDWGGLVLNGRAVTNRGVNVSLPGNIGPFGGQDDADNSGTLRYVRLEYGGKGVIGVGDANVFPLMLNAVGSGTTVEYVQTFFSGDNGINITGGTVRLRHLVVTGSAAHGIACLDGYRGLGQFWVVAHAAPQAPNDNTRGLNLYTNESNPGARPLTDPTLANLTLVGPGQAAPGINSGIRFRYGAGGKLYNAIVTGYPDTGVRAWDPAVASTGPARFSNSVVFDNRANFHAQTQPAWGATASFQNSFTPVPLTGFVGSTTTQAVNPPTLNAWFLPAAYIGAVEGVGPAADWTSRGTWVKNLDGSVR